MKYEASITAVGNLARTFLENNNSVILLDEGIRPSLSDMVVEHTPGKLTEDLKRAIHSSWAPRPLRLFLSVMSSMTH